MREGRACKVIRGMWRCEEERGYSIERGISRFRI